MEMVSVNCERERWDGLDGGDKPGTKKERKGLVEMARGESAESMPATTFRVDAKRKGKVESMSHQSGKKELGTSVPNPNGPNTRITRIRWLFPSLSSSFCCLSCVGRSRGSFRVLSCPWAHHHTSHPLAYSSKEMGKQGKAVFHIHQTSSLW